MIFQTCLLQRSSSYKNYCLFTKSTSASDAYIQIRVDVDLSVLSLISLTCLIYKTNHSFLISIVRYIIICQTICKDKRYTHECIVGVTLQLFQKGYDHVDLNFKHLWLTVAGIRIQHYAATQSSPADVLSRGMHIKF